MGVREIREEVAGLVDQVDAVVAVLGTVGRNVVACHSTAASVTNGSRNPAALDACQLLAGVEEMVGACRVDLAAGSRSLSDYAAGL